MKKILDINDINTWKTSSWMIPINFYNKNSTSFILQNGGKDDYCLDLSYKKGKDYFSEAWSSNTKSFVAVSKDDIRIYNWLESEPEIIKKTLVKDNLEKFHKYLASMDGDTSKEIIPYILKTYGQLRNLLDDKKNGLESLNLLFLLLASYEEKDINNVDASTWGIRENEIINSAEFEKYYIDFSKGMTLKNLVKPNAQLILRHVSGTLFQEAHNEAEFIDKCPDLFTGILSEKYHARKVQYSSVHYTPTYIARAIVENSLKEIDSDNKKLRILDPACGTSEFLMEVLKQLKTQEYKGEIEVVAFDTSDIAISTSQFLLTYEQREWKGKLKFKTQKVEDSLKQNWGNNFDLILMNPPFCSWEQMNKEEREAVRETLDTAFKGRANQASAFLYKAVNSIKENGVIGSVIPSSILTYNSYVTLRHVIKEILTPVLIAQLGNYVFKEALTNVSLFIGKKPRKNEMPLILWTQNEKNIAPKAIKSLRKFQNNNLPLINERDHSIYLSKVFPVNEDNWKLLSFPEEKIFTKIEKLVADGKLKRIKDIITVKQGIRTGHNKVFKLSLQEFNSLPKNEQKYFKPCIDNNSIQSGSLVCENYVWYPYNDEGMIVKTEEELQKEVPFYYNNILSPFKDDLITRATRKTDSWWKLTRHRAWLTSKYPKLVSTEFGKSNSFAFDVDGNFVVERGYGWIFKKNKNDLDYYYFYLAIFSCPFFNKLLSIYSRQLAGGRWWDLGKESTKNIPIPFLSKKMKELQEYQELIEIGRKIASGRFYDFDILEKNLLPFYQL